MSQEELHKTKSNLFLCAMDTFFTIGLGEVIAFSFFMQIKSNKKN